MKVLICVPAFNEEGKIEKVLARVPTAYRSSILVVNDGSQDFTGPLATSMGARVVSNNVRKGVGSAIQSCIDIAVCENYDFIAVMAGNNKDFPEDIELLLQPLISGYAEFVQGSRYLGSEHSFGAMPTYRKVATRLHSSLTSLASGVRVTDSTNGFRAFTTEFASYALNRLAGLRTTGYAFEPLLLMAALTDGYRFVEVPVKKVYPPKRQGQTKIRPILDWFWMLYPLVKVIQWRFTKGFTRWHFDD